ncbi:hypothetical protein BGX38DRAFT_1164871 [Terfezia claveryi]|nr:hypothetical protein BGX38DRAFT_1164871 [Terfezia claveryi]
MSFSSAIVFPGGNLDPTHDSFLLHKSTSLPAALPQDQFDLSPELVTALKTCAIRETFEETGVLLADPRTPDQPPPTESDLSKARSLLLGTKSATPPTTFSQILASLNLSLPLSSLYPFTTWITPLPSPKRYYTAIFGKYVIQPYTKRVLDGGENGKILLGIDKPRGDKTVWVKARFGKAGPREVEVLERESWKGEGARGKWRNGEKGREEGAGAGAKL